MIYIFIGVHNIPNYGSNLRANGTRESKILMTEWNKIEFN